MSGHHGHQSDALAFTQLSSAVPLGRKALENRGPVEKRASGVRGASCYSVGSFAFHAVFQYRASLRVNAHLVPRFLVA